MASSSSTTDIASIEAQLALSRASLADKIFARLGNSSGDSATSKKSNGAGTKGKAKDTKHEAAFQHRPPTLGLGAQPVQQPASQAGSINGNLSIADARLKGRLSSKDQTSGASSSQNGKRRAEDEEGDSQDDEEDNRGSSSKSQKKSKIAKVDPFASKSGKAAKQQQQQKITKPTSEEPAAPTSPTGEDASTKLSKSQRKKLNKKKKLEAEQGANAAPPTTSTATSPTAGAEGPSSAVPVNTGSSFQPSATLPDMDATPSSSSSLSQHQKSLHAKLQGSQFRQLNESLYTSASADSFRLAQEDPSRMQAYHEGFREQTKKWPEKPFEMIGNIIVDEMELSWKRLQSGASSKKAQQGASNETQIPPGALIADLGAGEGPLAKYLSLHSKLVGSKSTVPASLRPKVLAYDLLDTTDGIVRGVDCARSGGVPLPGKVGSGSGVQERAALARQVASTKNKQGKAVISPLHDAASSAAVADVAVFCLSLMGTDWVNMIIEARRILRSGGTLIIAEVTSRLSSVDDFVDLVQQLGFTRESGDGTSTGSSEGANTHFILLRFHKWSDGEVVERAHKSTLDDSVEEARGKDAENEQTLIEKGKAVLKPCLYKRR